MINIQEFSDRLKKIMEFHDETASSFSQKIGVQRSSISHILSGRNKPSLDFVMKVLHTYPNVDLYWLMNGTGKFPKPENTIAPPESTDLFSNSQSNSILPSNDIKPLKSDMEASASNIISINSNDDIERIVIFFKDGTFKSYT